MPPRSNPHTGRSRTTASIPPRRRHFLYYQRSSMPEHQGIFVRLTRFLHGNQNFSQRCARGTGQPGHLFIVKAVALSPQPFDERTFQPHGEPFGLASRLDTFSPRTYGAVTASHAASLPTVRPSPPMTSLQWRSRIGSPIGSAIASGMYSAPTAVSRPESGSRCHSGKPAVRPQTSGCWTCPVAQARSHHLDSLNDCFRVVIRWQTAVFRLYAGGQHETVSEGRR